jgi:hypothetical protein
MNTNGDRDREITRESDEYGGFGYVPDQNI